MGFISFSFISYLCLSAFVPKISQKIGQHLWWYTVHRLVNTSIIFALSFALFSGKMMADKWLPQGELNYFWYYGHLLSWLGSKSTLSEQKKGVVWGK